MRFFLFSAANVTALFAVFALCSAGNPLAFASGSEPLAVIVAAALTFAAVSFFAGILTNDYSRVDRLWSLVPVLYVRYYAIRGEQNPRLFLLAGLVTLWGTRLTFNFVRKGGYSGAEDNRWAEVRKILGSGFVWQCFNPGFISLYQNLLFVLFTLPAYRILASKTGIWALQTAYSRFFFLRFWGQSPRQMSSSGLFTAQRAKPVRPATRIPIF